MRRIVIVAWIVLFAQMLYADRIFLHDSTVVSGKVIKVTGKGIEIDPEGDVPFDVIPRDKVVKIVYDDGKEIYMAIDKIHLFDGKVIEGKIVEVTPAQILYTPKDSKENATISRDKVQSINFSDGRMFEMEKETGLEDALAAPVRVPGFHKSIVRIAGLIGFGAPTGDLVNAEQRAFEAHFSYLMNTFGPRFYDTSNAFMAYGGDIDLMLPSFEFTQRRGFDFTEIKLGVRGRYMYSILYSSIFDSHDYGYRYYDSDLFSGRLLTYNYWGVGPVIDFIFSTRANYINFLLNTYVLYGQIVNGKITAAPSLRDAGVFYNKTDYYSHFSGYTIRVGFGPHFALNKWVPVTIGINATYGFTRMKTGYPLAAHGGGDTVRHLHEWGAEISLGFHLL